MTGQSWIRRTSRPFDQYVGLANSFVRNPDLPLAARAVGAWLLSHSESYRFSVQGIATANRCGVDQVKAALRALEDGGYLTRQPVKDDAGWFVGIEYLMTDEPPIDVGRRTELKREEAEDEGGERVYLIGSASSTVVKIGRSCNVTRRLRAIQHMSPLSLAVLWTTPGGEALETRLHRAFAAQRQHGEWFDFQQDDPLKEITRFLGGVSR